jgi:hypothetical protein
MPSRSAKEFKVREATLLRLTPYLSLSIVLFNLQHRLLNVVFHDKAEHGARSCLSNLILDGRRSPNVCENDLVRRNEVQAHVEDPQVGKHDRAVRKSRSLMFIVPSMRHYLKPSFSSSFAQKLPMSTA